MLSRISLISAKSNQVALLRHTQLYGKNLSQSQLVKSFNTRQFTTDKESQKTDEVNLRFFQLSLQKEDYNLDEVAAPPKDVSSKSEIAAEIEQEAEPKYEKRPPRGGDRDQRRGGYKGSAMFKGGEGTSEKAPRERRHHEQEKQLTFEEYSSSLTFQQQNEIFKLIKEKIGSADKEKVQHFYNKLRSQPLNAKYLQSVTMHKIQALIEEQKVLDDRKIFEDAQLAQQRYVIAGNLTPETDQFYPAVNSTRTGPLSVADYEHQIEEQYEQYIKEHMINTGEDINEIEEEIINEKSHQYEQENPNEKDFLGEWLQEIRRDLYTQRPKGIFDFDRVTDDVVGFRQKIESEQEMKDIVSGKKHDLDEAYLQGSELGSTIRNEAAGQTQEEQQEFEDLWSSLNSDLARNLREDARSQYDQMRTTLKLNQQLRNRLLSIFKQTRVQLKHTQAEKKKLLNLIEKDHRELHNDLTTKHFDIISMNKMIENKTKFVEQYKQRDFNHASKNPDDYVKELTFLLSNYFGSDPSTKQRQKVLDRMQYVNELAHKNQVETTPALNSRVIHEVNIIQFFEFNALVGNNEQANQYLRKFVSGEFNEAYNGINQEVLEHFYTSSLKRDNFNGLAFLINYCEKYGVPIGNWPLESFKSALDFYLNKKFNLTNVLTFTRYFNYYHECRYREAARRVQVPIQKLSDGEKYALNQNVFNSQYLVDMRSLFGYLVEKVGSKQVLDPLTKEDPLWQTIEFFYRPGIQAISNYGETQYNIISESDVASYFRNHLNDNKTFERVTQTLIRSQGNEQLHNELIQVLKEYQVKNSSLPLSFDQLKIRNAYLRLKAVNSKNGVEVNEKTLEYFLYLFKTLKMWPEIIDLCDSFATLSGKSQGAGPNEIKNYYLSDSLLSMPCEQHYYKLIQNAVYDGQDNLTAGYTTAMTKAYLKDGSIDHGLKFFQDKVQALKEVKEKKEAFLVNLFDSVFGDQKVKDISYEDFKKKYLQSMKISNQVVKESFIVQQLRRLVTDKDYDELETLFQLYLVQQEESQILSSLPGATANFDVVQDTKFDNLDLSDNQRERLESLKLRRQALSSKLTEKDVEDLIALSQVMKNTKSVRVLNKNLSDKSADDIQKIFGIMNKEQVEDILKRTEKFAGAISKVDKESSILKAVGEKVEREVEKTLRDNMSQIVQMREYPDRNLDQVIETHYEWKKPNMQAIERTEDEFKRYQNYLYNGPITDEYDPELLKEEAYNDSLISMKEELLQAVNNRKGKVLQITLDIFNKLQDQTLKTVKLSTVANQDHENIDPSKINENIDKLDILLNNPRSPIMSGLQNLAQYRGDKDVPNFGKLYKDITSYFSNKLSIDDVNQETDQLQGLIQDLESSHQILKSINLHLQKMNTSHQNKSFFGWQDTKDTDLADALEGRLKKLYQDFKNSGDELMKPAEDLTRNEKLRLMSDVLSIEYSEQFASNDSVFPSFYCQDLIIFGLENSIPEAVRLGEKMMSENGYVLSRDLQKSVKSYLLENNEAYMKAAKQTGPIDNTSLYRTVQDIRDNRNQPAFFSLDDPYWKEYLNKNKKRQHQWRLPSYLAWDHKEMGVLGEIFDAKKIKETERQLRQSGYLI